MSNIKNSKLKIVAKAFEWLIFVVLLLVLIVVASPLLPTKDKASFYVIVSGSMEPAIPTGSLILVQSTGNARNFHQGDVISFVSPENKNQIITHRVFDVQTINNTVTYQTKGDHNDVADKWVVQPEMIKGQYRWHIPAVGYVIEWAKTPIGFAVAIGIPALIFIILQIRKIKQGINEEVEKRTRKALQDSHTNTDTDTDTHTHTTSSRLLSIAIATILSVSLIAATASPVQALFSAQVKIKGLTLGVADDGSQSHFPCGIVIWKVHWYKINHVYRLAWIELRNLNHHHVDLDDWYFDQSWRHKKIKFPHHAKISSDGFFTIVNSNLHITSTEDQPSQTDLTLPLDDLDLQSNNLTAFTLNQSNNQIADQMPMPDSDNWHSSHFSQHSRWHFPFWKGWWVRPILFCGWWNPWPQTPFPTLPPMPELPNTFPFNTLQPTPLPIPTPTITPTPQLTPTATPTPTPTPTLSVNSATPSASSKNN